MSNPAGFSDPPSVEAARDMGAVGGPVVEAERLAFEAWVQGHCWVLGANWDGESYTGQGELQGSTYVCPLAMRTRMMWAAWRDRAALCHQASSKGGD